MKVQEDAEKKIKDWEAELREQELAEKRRVAPGWLDRDEKILQPNRTNVVGSTQMGDGSGQSSNLMDQQDEKGQEDLKSEVPNPGGDELDRAFGGMGLKRK